MRVLLAPGAFSGALGSVAAAGAMRRGWQRQAPATTVVERAMSDGGVELLDAVHAARGGKIVSLTARGPLGQTVPATLLHVRGAAGGTVYIDAGQVIGRQLTAPGDELRHAEEGSSSGLGELLTAALGTGASRVVVGLGEGATHDAGAGALTVLGGATDAQEALATARSRLTGVDIVVATAADAPLLGLHGSGAMLAERPGIDSAQAQRISTAVGDYVAELGRHAAALPAARELLTMAGAHTTDHGHRPAGGARPGRADGSGAGGGTGYLLSLLGARVLPGAPVVARSIELAEAVAQSDVVVTGLSVLDADALDTGAVACVGQAAMEVGLPVVVLAEEIHTSRREVARAGISATYEIGEHADGPIAALEAWSARVARTWARTA